MWLAGEISVGYPLEIYVAALPVHGSCAARLGAGSDGLPSNLLPELTSATAPPAIGLSALPPSNGKIFRHDGRYTGSKYNIRDARASGSGGSE